MSIFRSVKKIKECDSCNGMGTVYPNPGTGDGKEQLCAACNGTGRVEVVIRASNASVRQAEVATKQLPPDQRKVAKARLAGDKKEGKVGYVEEE